jgi:CRISPR-associated endoribonuclease Cas6
MPISAIIQLEALTEGTLNGFTGRGVHGFWFQRWREVNPAVGDRLHSQSQESPFTLSPLMGLAAPLHSPISRPGNGGTKTVRVKAGQVAWFRATLLDEALGEDFLAGWLHGLETAGRFNVPEDAGVSTGSTTKAEQPGVEWKVTGSTVEAAVHPLAGRVPYDALSRRHLMASNPPRQWKVEFLTPTAFHGKVSHLPFPLPESLIGSWLRRWQAFAPIALPEEELTQWARSNLAVSAFRLHTLPVREGERLRVGCVGWLTLRALDMPPYLRAAVDLLAAYALFCGSGSHTAQGMGQTRLSEAK